MGCVLALTSALLSPAMACFKERIAGGDECTKKDQTLTVDLKVGFREWVTGNTCRDLSFGISVFSCILSYRPPSNFLSEPGPQKQPLFKTLVQDP